VERRPASCRTVHEHTPNVARLDRVGGTSPSEREDVYDAALT